MHIYLSPFLSNEKIIVKFNAILRQFIIRSWIFALDFCKFWLFKDGELFKSIKIIIFYYLIENIK